jgi:hypothetical protein
MIYLVENRLPQRIGNRYESVYPYDSFQAKDDLVIIGAAMTSCSDYSPSTSANRSWLITPTMPKHGIV